MKKKNLVEFLFNPFLGVGYFLVNRLHHYDTQACYCYMPACSDHRGLFRTKNSGKFRIYL